MFSTYRDIFTLPGALKFSVAGLIARIPMAVLGLGIVLFIQEVTGSYGFAGIMSAVYMGVQAIANPIIGRLVDRRGQSRIMVPLTVVHILAVIGLIAVVQLGAWTGLIVAFAGLCGATVGSVGALVRARWTVVTRNQKQLDTAFSWEAVADEVLFVTGPVLVTFLATALYPAAGLIMSAVGLAVGALLFYPQKSTEPQPHAVVDQSTKGKVLSNAGIFIVVVANFFVGLNFGAVDVATVAFAEEQGRKALAGASLGVYAAGSLTAGAIYGAITWKNTARLRYVMMLAVLSAGTWTLPLAHNMVTLSLALFVVGLGIAPSLIAASAIVQELAPARRLTEAFAWASTSMAMGVALGSAATGALIDATDASTSFLLPATCMTLATLVAALCYRCFDPARYALSTPVADRVVVNLPDSGTHHPTD